MATQSPPDRGVRAFLDDYHRYTTARETPDASTLTRYRDAQGIDEAAAPCEVCGMVISAVARLDCGTCV